MSETKELSDRQKLAWGIGSVGAVTAIACWFAFMNSGPSALEAYQANLAGGPEPEPEPEPEPQPEPQQEAEERSEAQLWEEIRSLFGPNARIEVLNPGRPEKVDEELSEEELIEEALHG